MSSAETQTATGKMPRQIPYIIANEGCERFSFYGMRNILTPFLISTLLLMIPIDQRTGEAKHVFHTFVIGVYFFPLLGGWLADRFFGKYNTIFWLSLVYCAGHACLALFENSVNGFYFGLFLIAFGSGGIKPLVASFVGDQFDQTNKHKAKLVFDLFYWIINFGSFFASLLMPMFLRDFGPSIAFGIPGLMMLAATVVFWMGAKKYVHVPPAPPNPDSFTRVARTALLARVHGGSRPGLYVAYVGVIGALYAFYSIPEWGFVISACTALVLLLAFGSIGTAMQLERARGIHPDEAVEGVRAVLRILVIFALVTPFFSLFDQKASTWIVQANTMEKPSWFLPAQMQALNPMLVMLLIPFNNLVLYPMLNRFGLEATALRRMTAGIGFSSLAWIVIGLLQLALDSGNAVSIMWQILPYALLTFGEVLVSATGLEFAYSQAPVSMKGAIMSFWNLSTTVGNLWVLIVNRSVMNEGVIGKIAESGISVTAFQMFFFAAFAAVAMLAFGLYAKRYKMVDNYRQAAVPGKA
ncbi:Di-/tripeptide transporter [Janthinobacterium sp. HH103]|uniref:POT-type proton-dependent oligopeptide transporter n=1 Tax=unclassified Janthinobacterium TaxID=2610881 RepID=UPI000874C83F|nr:MULTISPECIES: oligopeptide:H+ symporter [unclassified Janthinobacterium]OEZ70291.1 Di-/tripeptide transporter [Janthinobacterium sp. HH100]OEZ73476.1 Di-/tripeptide transporter [Janthinobacterium sp. HH103]QOU75343.1 Di-/tripeptide transporter [Janthinobacterium sp. HH102]